VENPPSLGDKEFADLFGLARLRRTWRNLKREIRLLEVRDAVDWLDWSVSLDASLGEVREALLSGSYTPSPPTRYEVGKSKGSFRVITALNIRDALVYRHICDEVYRRSLPLKIPGAFFSRHHSRTPVGHTLSVEDDFYLASFEVWLHYNQYRTTTMLSNAYRTLVVADIANYFDSISHDILLEYLAPLGLPRKAVGLLGRLLEAFKPTTGHSPNPRIGLAVVELDCSRQLAHVFLYEHDHRIVHEAGPDNYVRWMDDQNIGARDEIHGRRIVNDLVRSLSSQRLTLNDGKTQLLDLDHVVLHFQLGPNTELDELKARHNEFRRFSLPAAQSDFETVWDRISTGENVAVGAWDKIVKRAYGVATTVDSPVMESRALEDLISWPAMGNRIFRYFALRDRTDQLLALFIDYCAASANLYEASEAQFFEALLLTNATRSARRACEALARDFARGHYPGQTGRPLARGGAILCLYWHGSPTPSLPSLYSPQEARDLPKEVARAWMVCTAALNPRRLPEVQARLVGHQSDDVARLSHFLTELLVGNTSSLGEYKSLKPRWPLSGEYYDARSWLAFELASRSPNPDLRAKTRSQYGAVASYARSPQERRVAQRVRRRLWT